MKKSRLLIIIAISLCLVHRIVAGDIKVGLLYGKKVSSVVFSVVEGEYIIFGDNRQVSSIRKGAIHYIENNNGRLVIQDTSKSIGSFIHIEIRGISNENVFRLKPVFPSAEAREYDGNVTFQPSLNFISVINTLNIEKYIEGVLEAEGGSNAHPEYYKAQAILVRTFALKNFYRHGSEGFNLCDAEHCQAYKGKSLMNKEIMTAVSATRGQVLVNQHGNLVVTPFHSNCGGMTSDAYYAWQQMSPNLQPIKDPFCMNSRNANWEVSLTRRQWTDYLLSKGFDMQLLQQTDFRYHAKEREKYYVAGKIMLPMTDIRKDLKLKSAWFSVAVIGDSVILRGRGYGHGVGLCQEGAMSMAKKGYVYIDILHFYFSGVQIRIITDE
jgi:stage II sporulation protein D